MDGTDYRAARARHEAGPDKADIRSKLNDYRKAGVTFYRDGGDPFGVGLYAAQIAPEYGIDLRTPGFAIHKRGKYGSIVGVSFETMAQFRELVREAGHRGGDFIKIMCSGIIDFRDGSVTEEPPETDEIRGMVETAHEDGFAVMAHVDGTRAVMDAVRAGAYSVEHGFFADTECLAAMKEAGTIWVPTISAAANLIGSSRYPDHVVRQITEGHAGAVREAWKLQVCVAPGSDAGAWRVPHVQGIRDEFRHLCAALGGCASREEVREWLEKGEAAIRERFRRG